MKPVSSRPFSHIIFYLLFLAFTFVTVSCPQPVVPPQEPETAKDLVPPGEAADFTATAMDGIARLSWTEPDDGDFAGVEVSCNPKAGSLANPQTLKKGVAALTVYGLENGAKYTFTVKTMDTSGNISQGVTVSATPVDSSDRTAPGEAENFTATAMDGAVWLSWTDAADSDVFGYELVWTSGTGAVGAARAVAPMEESSLFVSPGVDGVNGVTVGNLANGTQYTFTLRTMDTSGNKSAGVSVSCSPAAVSVPEVTRLTALWYDGKTHLSWTNPGGSFAGVEIFSDGRRMHCEAQSASSTVYGNYGYCVLEDTLPGKAYIVRSKNAAGQVGGGVAVTSVDTGLPVVVVDTDGGADVISKDDYVNMNFMVWDGSNSKNSFSNMTFSDGIRRRGNSSYSHDKKPYRIKFDKKTSLFGLAKAKSWVLLANYQDPTLLMNDVTFKLGEVVKLPFTNHGVHIDFILNGKYLGTYLLTEQVQVNEGRVDIGGKKGILAELDVYYDEEPKFKTTNYQLPVMFKNPEVDGDDIALLQDEVALIEKLDAAVYNNGAATVADNLWTEIADVSTFAKFLLCNQIVKNGELGHPKSTYIYRDSKAGSKFCMGPLWDFDWAFGYVSAKDSYFVGGSASGDSGRCAFFQKLYSDATFKAEYKTIWSTYRAEISELTDYMKAQRTLLEKSAVLNRTVWGFTKDTSAEIDKMVEWWNARVNWVDSFVNDL